MSIINAIKLPESFDSYENINEEKLEFLEPISRINIFVGANNSGKSRFLRLLSSQESYEIKIPEEKLINLISELNLKITNIENSIRENGYTKINEIDSNKLRELRNIPNTINLSKDNFQTHKEIFRKWSNIYITTVQGPSNQNVLKKIKEIITNNSVESLKILEDITNSPLNSNPKCVYIPVLRGLRPINEQLTDFYTERTYTDYFPDNGKPHPQVFSGLTFYQRLTKLLLGGNNDRKKISDYQDFISKNLFENKPITLIPNQQSKIVVVKIGDEKEQPIFHLGDGIQSIIILSFLPFITEEPTFFFIEEPEIYLHPGLQRKIINFFSLMNQHHFFLTTHSNHFLDLTIDFEQVAVFSFRKILPLEDESDEKIPKFTVQSVDGRDNSSLELLGVRNSSVFLVNATIWVEGITDRWYLRKMIECYIDYLNDSCADFIRLEEDLHYSFVEYGGANITHWSFLDYEIHPIQIEHLCSKAILIIDKDGDKKLKRKEDLQRILENRLIILPGREIENLLPFEVIKQVILEYEGDPNKPLPNIKNDLYKDKYLGTFIESKVLKNQFTRKGGYKSQSGSIKSKVDFCKKSLPYIRFAELSVSTQEMIKNIYDFILSQNK